jgi:Xaa-Pro aminopeptidase
MLASMKHRTEELQRRLADEGVDLALLTDQDSIAYYGGFWGYLGVEFGRPTFMLVPRQGAPSVITPLMESEMVAEMTWPWTKPAPPRFSAGSASRCRPWCSTTSRKTSAAPASATSRARSARCG